MLYILFYAASIGISMLAIRIKEELASHLLIASVLFLITTFWGYYPFKSPDWNPHTTNADLVGNWQDGDSRITLKSDGSASFDLTRNYATRIGLNDSVGGWHKKSDFTIKLLPYHMDEQCQVDAIKREGNTFRITKTDSQISFTRSLRIIKIDDKLCLVLLDSGDSNSWDGRPGFVLQNKLN